jgi:hypothetical protein
MVKLKTIIVDDELLARRLMLSCLDEIPEIEKFCLNAPMGERR